MPSGADVLLPGEVIDRIAELIVLPAEPGDRAAVISALVTEMYATLAWREGADRNAAELVSLRGFVVEAEAHQHRTTAAVPAAVS
jgi:hypothetical protein